MEYKEINMEATAEEAMQRAIKESEYNLSNNYQKGGPFGAVIIKDGKIVSIAHNTVIESKDATAHAEVNAIRLASKNLNTHDLTGCKLYVNAEPCPMCLSAIIWSNIKEVYFANTKKDAEDIGFRDDMIYRYLENRDDDVVKVNHIESKEAKKIFEDFKNNKNKQLY